MDAARARAADPAVLWADPVVTWIAAALEPHPAAARKRLVIEARAAGLLSAAEAAELIDMLGLWRA